MSGGGGGFGQALVNQGMRMGGQAPAQGQGGADYSAPAPMTPYASAFSSRQGAAAPQQLSPFAQQMMQSSRAPNPMFQEAMGLQAALAQMGAQFNQPMMRSQFMPMPTYQSSALSYRPDIASVQQNLSRVVPSVAEQQRLQAIEDARIAAEQAAQAEQQPQYESHTIGGG
jgi:hypothetical protein